MADDPLQSALFPSAVLVFELLMNGFDPTSGNQFVPLRKGMDAVPDPVRGFGVLAGFVEHLLRADVCGLVV